MFQYLLIRLQAFLAYKLTIALQDGLCQALFAKNFSRCVRKVDFTRVSGFKKICLNVLGCLSYQSRRGRDPRYARARRAIYTRACLPDGRYTTGLQSRLWPQSFHAHPRACVRHMHGTRRRETHGHAHARPWKRNRSKAAGYTQERGCV